MTLEAFFHQYPKAALAFSGGVDSAYLLYAAGKYGADVRAYYVNSAFQPDFELRDAQALARQLGAAMEVIPVDVLSRPEIVSNSPDRCYHCKKRIFSAILRRAREAGYDLVIDGTNASDDLGSRPGVRALRELSVRSPLLECGITKAQVREWSREAGLFTWDKSAYACLATRIPTGRAITRGDLERTQRGEDFLSCLGFRDFRVRLDGETAKLQVIQEQLPLVLAHREEILETLGREYKAVVLDLEVRHG